jgi:hypothetical protein
MKKYLTIENIIQLITTSCLIPIKVTDFWFVLSIKKPIKEGSGIAGEYHGSPSYERDVAA